MKRLLKILKALIGIALAAVIFVLYINVYMVNSAKDKIYDFDEIGNISGDYDCVIVFGAGVKPNGEASDMLADRMKTGIAVLNERITDRMIVSGDHGRKNYDEVRTMKDYAVEQGIPSDKIFKDHAGFSTYDTLYRARDVFKVKKAILVTQKYHLSRALYLAQNMGIEAVGVSADLRSYRGQNYRELRECIARTKDVFSAIFKPKPKYLGEEIPVFGNGDVTDD